MLVIEDENQFLSLIEKGIKKSLELFKEEGEVLSGWKAITAFLGIGKHQIKENYNAGLYGDALQICGRVVLLNKKRFWEVLKEREEK